MTEYLALLAPSSNRVYSGEAVHLAKAELAVLAAGLTSATIKTIETTTLAGVPYISFTADELTQTELDRLANLSAGWAWFERYDDRLRPVAVNQVRRFDDDLMTIPKYSGKTNEQFTKLLLNVTIASTAWAAEFGVRRFSVLDPLAGRGTTLDQALTYGFDAAGVEIEEREVDAYATFLGTYLKRKRLKHSMEYAPMKRDGKRVGKRLAVEVNTDAAAFKLGDRQSLTMFCADTLDSAVLFGKRRFDAIVADSPYGVIHGSRTGGGRDRSAAELLTVAIPVWSKLLRAGGALGVAWNTLGLERSRLVEIVTGAGLDILDDDPYLGFSHRVDSSIVRDVVVARRL